MKIAAIDIGSNAARLQISSVLPNEGSVVFKKVEYVRFPLRLGHDVFSYGSLTKESIDRTIRLMKCYKLLMELHEVAGIKACATSAIRESKNSAEVVKRVFEETGIKIEIIDGSMEAELINNVVIQSLGDGQYLHIDVGGGSTELNLYFDRQKIKSKSFKIGSVRLLEGKENNDIWGKIRSWILDYVNTNEPVVAVGTGGNINKLFGLVAKLTETTTSLTEIERMRNYIASFSLEDRINKLRLNADRADVIIPAADIYISAMKWAKADTILVPDVGLKDGILQLVYEEINNK